jgi:hypothetical protein
MGSLPFLLTLDSAAIRNQLEMLENILVLDSDILRDKILDELDPRLAFRIIGYDTQNLPAAKLPYIQENINTDLSKEDKIVLYNCIQALFVRRSGQTFHGLLYGQGIIQ